MKRALIVSGGWDGHQPRQVAEIFRGLLERESFSVEVAHSLDAFTEAKRFDLIVPVWTMGQITDVQLNSICQAVRDGVGIAGCHGGMCDAFRSATEWHFMTGGQWVAHPGNDGVRYRVHFTDSASPITEGLADFDVVSEQYYLHVDPAVTVLATTRFPVADGPHVANGPVDMPVVWTKRFGAGRVFYCSLGHQADIVEMPQVTELMRRGFLWTAANRAS
jgi:uncharacterized protein